HSVAPPDSRPAYLGIAMTLPLLPLSIARLPAGLRQALSQEGVPCIDVADASFPTRFVLFDSRFAPSPKAAEGQRAVDLDFVRSQEGRDVFADLVDERSAQRAWHVGWLDAIEEVARVDKRQT